MTTLRLVDGNNTLQIYPNPNIELQSLDLGYPEVREDISDAPDTDGQIDLTTYYGGRVIAIELALLDTPLALADQVRAFTSPAARPYLYVGEDEWGSERRARVRSAQATITRQRGLLQTATMQLQWKAPDGILEDATQQTISLPVFSPASSTGVRFPTTFAMSWPITMNTSAQTFPIQGSVPINWVGRLYGPCTGPRFSLDTTGETLSFPTLTLAAGDYLEIDTRNHTALVNGSPDASRLGQLDFAASTWWRLRPGTNTVRYNPVTVAGGAQAVLFWRPAWL
jgi:hypothetical protein